MLKLFSSLEKVCFVYAIVNVKCYLYVCVSEPSRNNLDRNTRTECSVGERVAQDVKAQRLINADSFKIPVPVVKYSTIRDRTT